MIQWPVQAYLCSDCGKQGTITECGCGGSRHAYEVVPAPWLRAWERQVRRLVSRTSRVEAEHTKLLGRLKDAERGLAMVAGSHNPSDPATDLKTKWGGSE